MLQNKTIKKITGLRLALFLIAGQFFVEGASVQAAGKQKTLNITDLSLSVGQSQKLKVLNGKKVRWSSSKKTVASVSKKGVVKAKKKGKAVITAKAGKWKRKARITVKAKKKKDNSSGDNQNETKQPAETEKPVVTDRPDVTPLPTEKPTEEPSPTKKPEDDNGNTGVAENEKIPKKLQEIPAVEGTYSTYADNVTPEGIKASRDHRAFGGFSMGSVGTWDTFLICLDAFRYFMPSSGAIDSTGNRLDSFPAALELSKKGYNAFALIYRPGEQTACEDLARAVSFWEKHIK